MPQINPSTLSSALNDVNKGTAHMPDDWPRVRDTIIDGVYRDILAYTQGNKSQTVWLFLDLITKALGDMLWRVGDPILEGFNRGLARHESKFTAILAWGKPTPPKTTSE